MERKREVQISKEELEKQAGFLRDLKNECIEKQLTFHIETFGCQMNEHDSEKLKGMLFEAGFSTAENMKKADLVIFNTCCVREHAETKVFGNVGMLGKLKRSRPDLIIGVCGCMMQQEDVANDLFKRFPFVDMVFGTHVLHTFPEILYKAVCSRTRVLNVAQSEGTIVEELPIVREKGSSAYVTVMYGCDNYCSYCIVPYVRGRERSRLMEDIEREVIELVEQGYVEITLLGQNVNSYGADILYGPDFATLLRRLNEIDGLKRIHFMTSHPKDLSPALIEAVAECDKVYKHIHLPVQSGSNRILTLMNRKYSREDYGSLVKMLRARIPDVELTTDIIVGFPGETEDDFNDTLELMASVGFSAAFTFMYSKRTGTKAATMEDQVDLATKKRRLSELNALQSKMTAQNNEKYLSKTYEVLVEGCDERAEPLAFGKTNTFKMIYFPSNCDASLIGSFVNVKATKTRKNSLIGELMKE